MPQYDGTVAEFEDAAASMSEDELKAYAEDDDRVGIQEAAQEELDSRGGSVAEEAADTGLSEDLEAKMSKSLLRPENAAGVNLDPDVGQNEVQARFDEMEISGVTPPTGGPPDPSHTVQGVTNTLDEDAGTREKADADFETLHGRAPGDPVV